MNYTEKELNELPEELKKELKILKKNDLENEILNIFKTSQKKTVSIDEILICLFRSTNTIYKRNFISNKIYRMTKKGLLKGLKERGFYSLETSKKD